VPCDDCKRWKLHVIASKQRIAKPLYGQKLYRGFESPSPPGSCNSNYLHVGALLRFVTMMGGFSVPMLSPST